jgi:hypothetical protein
MIKGRSKVMNHIASGAYNVERQTGHLPEIVGMKRRYRMGRGARLWVGRDYCYFFKRTNRGLQVTEMLLGPLDLNPNKDNSVVSV